MLLLTYSSTGANGAAGAAAEALLPELGQIMLMLQHLYSVQALFACALPFLLLADESVFMLLKMMNLPLDLVCFNLPRWTCFWLLLAAFQILIAILKLCYFFFAAAGGCISSSLLLYNAIYHICRQPVYNCCLANTMTATSVECHTHSAKEDVA